MRDQQIQRLEQWARSWSESSATVHEPCVPQDLANLPDGSRDQVYMHCKCLITVRFVH